jgi:hypothetical protein
MSASLTLPNIRSSLIRQEDSIIFTLIERAQFAQNPLVYQPGGVEVPGVCGVLSIDASGTCVTCSAGGVTNKPQYCQQGSATSALQDVQLTLYCQQLGAAAIHMSAATVPCSSMCGCSSSILARFSCALPSATCACIHGARSGGWQRRIHSSIVPVATYSLLLSHPCTGTCSLLQTHQAAVTLGLPDTLEHATANVSRYL